MAVNKYLKYAIRLIHDHLVEKEGQAVGVRFNKFLYLLDRDLANLKPQPINLKLPYRWYFYGVIPISRQLTNILEYTHPENEWSTVVELKPFGQPELTMNEKDTMTGQFLTHYAMFPTPEDNDLLIDYTYEDAKDFFQNASRELYLCLRHFKKKRDRIPGHLESYVKVFVDSFPDQEPYRKMRLFVMRISGPLRYCCSDSTPRLDMAKDLHWLIWKMYSHLMGIDHRMCSESVTTNTKNHLKIIEGREWIEFKCRFQTSLDLFYTQIYEKREGEEWEEHSDAISDILLDTTGLSE